MEIVAYQENVRQRMAHIYRFENKEAFFSSHQKEIRKLLNHPSMTGANSRNAVETLLPNFYKETVNIGINLISIIDATVKNQKPN